MPKPTQPHRTLEVMSKEDAAFMQGFCVALADLIRLYDRPAIAKAIFEGCGFTAENIKAAKVDPYDAKPLLRAIK